MSAYEDEEYCPHCLRPYDRCKCHNGDIDDTGEDNERYDY